MFEFEVESDLEDSSHVLQSISHATWTGLSTLDKTREKFGNHLVQPSALHILLALSKLVEYHNQGDLIKIFISELFYVCFHLLLIHLIGFVCIAFLLHILFCIAFDYSMHSFTKTLELQCLTTHTQSLQV